VFADSLVRAVAPRGVQDVEAGLLLAPAYVALDRLQDARRESDATYALLRNLSIPRRHIPGVIGIAWVDLRTGRADVALTRLGLLSEMKPGFYISRAILQRDARWQRLRSLRGFEQFVAALE
jgi:hypothetical protein